MTMRPGLRKFVLAVHITNSVGWIGALIAYVSLVIAAMNSQDTLIVRAAGTGMELIAWYVLVPLAFASLLTGLVMSLGTKWGLFQHYWVLISFLLTLIATIVLLTQLESISSLAAVAAEMDSATAYQGMSGQLFHAGCGLLVLLTIQALNVYKPRGLTPYGWRKQREQRIDLLP